MSVHINDDLKINIIYNIQYLTLLGLHTIDYSVLCDYTVLQIYYTLLKNAGIKR